MTTLIVLGVAVLWPLGIWCIFRAGDRETPVANVHFDRTKLLIEFIIYQNAPLTIRHDTFGVHAEQEGRWGSAATVEDALEMLWKQR